MKNKNLLFPWHFVLWVLTLSTGYAVVRYVVFGATAVKDIPLYIGNQVLAISSLIFFIRYLMHKNYYLGGLSYLFLIGHLIISVLIVSPAYFSHFFNAQSELNGYANWSLFFGVFSFLSIWVFHQIKKGNQLFIIFSNKILIRLILTGIGLHLFFMGFDGWFQPGQWKGGLPPITLVGFVLLFLVFFRRR